MAAVGFQQTQKSSINFALSLDKSTDVDNDLSQRIEEFKHQNPEEVEELKKCIQEVLGEAEKTAQERLEKKTSDEAKEKNLNAFMSGLKDKNKRVVTRARSLARSLIDTICNCTNNVSNPLQHAATRLRRQQTAYERSSSTPRQQTRFED
ncbi:CLUMA_CG003814, isoform A [Clunio marinus]|uniref:CLUMA_CG003814, isoform A n=1 Tax=Clunio marinus TaxID=568069 RepID=A0A1J1HPW2_9DIPT|nr:CLUMA_CG003814, isoform A [Clunio marinus]